MTNDLEARLRALAQEQQRLDTLWGEHPVEWLMLFAREVAALAAQEQPTRAQVEQLRKQGLLECRPNFKYGYNTAIRDVLALFPKEE